MPTALSIPGLSGNAPGHYPTNALQDQPASPIDTSNYNRCFFNMPGGIANPAARFRDIKTLYLVFDSVGDLELDRALWPLASAPLSG